jgi:hypothetical protein
MSEDRVGVPGQALESLPPAVQMPGRTSATTAAPASAPLRCGPAVGSVS